MTTTMTRENMIAIEMALRAEPFASDISQAMHEKYKHLLPTVFPTRNPGGHKCNPGDVACHCSWEFERGKLYAQWSGGDEQDSRRTVIRVLGQILNDNADGTISGDMGDWVVGRILASDVPAGVGKMVFFAPSSITAGRYVPCEEPVGVRHEQVASS